ncbi:MAG: hypothetical protein GY790_07325 [Bacteroidetes bacterium]|nr:hypothetical protein [Bacteroidota bacterium]
MNKTQFLLHFPAQFYTFCFASCGEKNVWKRSMKAAGDYLVEVMGIRNQCYT